MPVLGHLLLDRQVSHFPLTMIQEYPHAEDYIPMEYELQYRYNDRPHRRGTCKTGGLLTFSIETANKCVILPQSPPKIQKFTTALPPKRMLANQIIG